MALYLVVSRNKKNKKPKECRNKKEKPKKCLLLGLHGVNTTRNPTWARIQARRRPNRPTGSSKFRPESLH